MWTKSINEEAEKRNLFSHEKKILWWKPTSGNSALHKMADLEIVTQLARKNNRIYLMVPASKEKMTLPQKNSKVRIISIRMKSLPFIIPVARSFLLLFYLPICFIAFRLNFIIVEPDVSILSFIPLVILSKLTKTKLILDIRSVPVETFGFLGFMMNFWFTISVMFAKKYFSGITAITELMKAEVSNRFKINQKKIGVWTSGVSTQLFDPSKYNSNEASFKDKLGVSSKFVVFYHGVFSPTRGLKQSIEAIKILKNSYPDIVLYLLGTGPIIPALKTLIQKEKLECNVIIHDPVDQKEVPRFINMCDVAILPLPNNQFWRSQSPLKLLEYLAMEKVVILTDIPAHKSVIGKEKCGLYITSIEPMTIAEAIKYAYINRAHLRSWAETGRKMMIAKYTWQSVASDLNAFLLSVDNTED